jgi:hypothetical protein
MIVKSILSGYYFIYGFPGSRKIVFQRLKTGGSHDPGTKDKRSPGAVQSLLETFPPGINEPETVFPKVTKKKSWKNLKLT